MSRDLSLRKGKSTLVGKHDTDETILGPIFLARSLIAGIISYHYKGSKILWYRLGQ